MKHEKVVILSLRMPVNLYEVVKDASEKESRSVNNYINTIIKRYLDEHLHLVGEHEVTTY